MAKFIAKTLPDVALSTLKPEFDAIAEDCSLLNVSVSGENTLILTIDTDFVITFVNSGTQSFSSVSMVLNGNSIASKGSGTVLGINVSFRALYSESFFFFALKGGSYIPWGLYEKLDGGKFANANISGWVDSYCPMKDMDNKTINRVPTFNYSAGIDTIDFSTKYTLATNSSPYIKVAESSSLYLCSGTGLNSAWPDKIFTINNHDYYTLTPYILVPIDSE